MAGIFGKIKQKLSRAGSKMDKYQEAITFAQAGESEEKKDTTRLDLHGTKHGNVQGKVIRLVEKYWDIEKELTVVTGHSPKMRKLVTDVLDEYGLEYYIGGTLGISNSFLTFYSGSSAV